MQAMSTLVKRVQKTGGALFGALSLFALVAYADVSASTQANFDIPVSSDIQVNYEILTLDGKGAVVHTQKINVLRSESQVYKAYPLRGIAERWLRSSRGRVQYQRIYFQQRLIIDYGEGDVVLLGKSAAFPQGLQMIDRQLDPHWRTLPNCGEKASPEGMASCFGTGKIELYWLTEHALPLSASWLRGEYHYQLRLLSLKPATPAILEAQLDTFEEIDFADIGDNEAHSGLTSINTGQFRGAGYSQKHRH